MVCNRFHGNRHDAMHSDFFIGLIDVHCTTTGKAVDSDLLRCLGVHLWVDVMLSHNLACAGISDFLKCQLVHGTLIGGCRMCAVSAVHF